MVQRPAGPDVESCENHEDKGDSQTEFTEASRRIHQRRLDDSKLEIDELSTLLGHEGRNCEKQSGERSDLEGRLPRE